MHDKSENRTTMKLWLLLIFTLWGNAQARDYSMTNNLEFKAGHVVYHRDRDITSLISLDYQNFVREYNWRHSQVSKYCEPSLLNGFATYFNALLEDLKLKAPKKSSIVDCELHQHHSYEPDEAVDQIKIQVGEGESPLCKIALNRVYSIHLASESMEIIDPQYGYIHEDLAKPSFIAKGE